MKVEDFYGKKLDYTLPYYFIDSDLEEVDEKSIEVREEILNWAKGLPPFNIKDLEIKDPRYKKQYEDYDNDRKYSEDSDYEYTTIIQYKIIKAIDLNNNIITLSDRIEIGRTTTSHPKKKSLWTKIVGGAMIGAGVLAAPFSLGATLVGVGGGIATIASTESE